MVFKPSHERCRIIWPGNWVATVSSRRLTNHQRRSGRIITLSRAPRRWLATRSTRDRLSTITNEGCGRGNVSWSITFWQLLFGFYHSGWTAVIRICWFTSWPRSEGNIWQDITLRDDFMMWSEHVYSSPCRLGPRCVEGREQLTEGMRWYCAYERIFPLNSSSDEWLKTTATKSTAFVINVQLQIFSWVQQRLKRIFVITFGRKHSKRLRFCGRWIAWFCQGNYRTCHETVKICQWLVSLVMFSRLSQLYFLLVRLITLSH